MANILVLGAGRSSSALIHYLLTHANAYGWNIRVGDISERAALEAVSGFDHGEAELFDIRNEGRCAASIGRADIVISMLPATYHHLVAKHCLDLKKHLATASYVSDEMSTYHSHAVENNLLFLNECGLDPGIDHMSAMQVIDRIKSQGGEIVSFESFTGGLIDPTSDPDNPWRYRFTWNPRNVVMAGQGTAKYLNNGRYRYIPYQQLFRQLTEVTVPGAGVFEGYANRDSLKYITTYGLDGVQSMLRGTLRFKGFCEAWNILVQLGCCDDTYQMENVGAMTHRGFISSFLHGEYKESEITTRIAAQTGVSSLEALRKLEWSGFFSDELVGLNAGSPAQILEHILAKRWKLSIGNRDLIVMQHKFVYNLNGKSKTIVSNMVSRGDSSQTSMAKTVGLPLAIAAKLLLTGKIQSRGVVIPVKAEFYEPVLSELKALGISLDEREL